MIGSKQQYAAYYYLLMDEMTQYKNDLLWDVYQEIFDINGL